MKIFLDIDGVMVKAIPYKQPEFEEDGFYKFNEYSINMINYILTIYQNDEVEIILTTSHRFKYNLDQWKEIFEKRGILAPISRVGFTVNLNRKEEILYWVEKLNICSEEYIIIDDDKSLNGLPNKLKKRLILTDPFIGLTYYTDWEWIKNTIMKENFTREEVLEIIGELLERPDILIDVLNNENTNHDVESLLKLTESIILKK